MQGKNDIQILSTRLLPTSLEEEISSEGISLDSFSFIEIEAIQSVEVQQEIEQVYLQSTTVVFTSTNAVEAVVTELDDQQPDWFIYCTGNTTRQMVARYFGEEKIAGTASSAGELAEIIIDGSHSDEIVFFCGNERREELPALLRKNDIDVNEIVVYQTIATPHQINKPYHGILFFSPSAVKSFFRKNKVNDYTILFAIGPTTANEIQKNTDNKIIMSDEPGKENLVRKMIEYFT